MISGADEQRVRALLGREPQGQYQIVVRDATGDPVVLRNAPFLDDGTPMPTTYWLIGPQEIRRIGHLEASGGVNAAEAAIDPSVLAEAHDRYAAERDASIDPGHTGPRPSGGVGGTRLGVKCLHAHWAWHLAGGDDPVGQWIADQFAASAPTSIDTAGSATQADSGARAHQATIDVDHETITVDYAGRSTTVPWGPDNLTAAWLAASDPPLPEDLTNALGTIDDYLTDICREQPTFLDLAGCDFSGPPAIALAQLELGHPIGHDPVVLSRDAAEEIFRLVATEAASDRVDNPGLPSEAVDSIIATCIIVLVFMRHLKLSEVTLSPAPASPNGPARR